MTSRLQILTCAGLLTAGLFAACNFPGARGPAAGVATPVPGPSSSATQGQPPPPPTPTLLPIEVAQQGERDLRNGDWDSAVVAFQLLLNDPTASGETVVTAQLGLAQASLKQGDFSQAQRVLDGFLAANPSHPRAAQAYFLRGDAKMGLGDWSGAVTDFQMYLSLRPGLIDSYVYERIGDCYLNVQLVDQAMQSYEQAITADRYLVGLLQLREKTAEIYRSLGNPEAAVAQYQGILSIAQNHTYRGLIDYEIGETYFEAELYDEAYNHLNYVFLTYPDSFNALSALRALLEAGYTVDQYQRGIVNYNQGQYDIAVEAFLNYWAATSPSSYTADSYLYVARSYRALGNPQSALTLLQVMATRYGPEDGDAWAEGRLEIASLHAELGDNASAYQAYEEFATDYASLPQAADALVLAAQTARFSGDTPRAAAYLQRLAVEHPDDSRASASLYDLGIAAYQSGDLSTAEALFSAAASLSANERPGASYFWLGRTLQAAGRVEEANAAFASAISADGADGYYGLRASAFPRGEAPFTRPASVNLSIDPDEGRADAEQWIVQRFALDVAPPLASELRADLASDLRMVRGRELWDLGMTVEAKQDFEAVRQAFQDDPLATYQLAIYFREIGLYRSSILAASRLMTLAGVEPLEAPPFLGRLRYPIYFADLVSLYSTQYNLDPLLVFALIWQESVYEGFATSSASAQGLMQIWPPTGEDIAERLAWPGYQTSDLQRPYVSVAFGTWLLSDELARFDGNVYAVLSAYNAGTGQAADWLAASAGDNDLFVEVIDLNEPQTYVRRISEHYAFYRILYGIP